MTHSHSETERIIFFFAPSDSQPFGNGAYQLLLCSKCLTVTQKWSALACSLLQVTYNHSEMQRINFFFSFLLVTNSLPELERIIVQNWSASNGGYFFLQMTHSHSEMECIIFFFAPRNSLSFKNEADQFLLCAPKDPVFQKWSVSVFSLLQVTHNHSETEYINFFLAPNDSLLFRNEVF